MRFILVLSFLFTIPLTGAAGSAPPSSPGEQPEEPSFEDLTYPPRVPAVPQMPPLQGKPQKIHKWTGNLVDANCMADALRQVPSLGQMLIPEPLDQQAWQISQHPSQMTGSPSTQGQPPLPGLPNSAPGPNGDPEISERELALQAAQLKRANLMEQQVKACAPQRPTSHFGLFVSDGYLLKFDAAGDFKALDALRALPVRPGKNVRAKVTGVMVEEADTVRVASIEIKSQIRSYQQLFESSSLH